LQYTSLVKLGTRLQSLRLTVVASQANMEKSIKQVVRKGNNPTTWLSRFQVTFQSTFWS